MPLSATITMRGIVAVRALASASAVSVTRVPLYNQALNVLERKGVSAGGTVQYLGTFSEGIDACEAACLETGVDSADRCNYYIYFPSDQGSTLYASQCYSVTTPGWNPSYDETAITGMVEWPCQVTDRPVASKRFEPWHLHHARADHHHHHLRQPTTTPADPPQSDEDCSLNGVCNAGGSCDCRTAWSGDRCETLNLLPTTHHAGYRGTDDGHNTSSWGGAVLPGPDGKYHMWASEMTEHCGIGAWAEVRKGWGSLKTAEGREGKGRKGGARRLCRRPGPNELRNR